MLKSLLSLLLVFSFCGLFAQDTIVKMDGKIKPDVEVIKSDFDYVYFFNKKQQKRNNYKLLKPKKIKRLDVFEIWHPNGDPEVIYREKGFHFLSPTDSMRQYVYGSVYALENVHNRIIGPLSFALTFGSYFASSSFGIYQLFVFAVPYAIATISSNFTPKISRKDAFVNNQNDLYKMAYKDIKRSKKIKSATILGYTGLATAFIIRFLTK